MVANSNKATKMVKYICPNNCGSFRMLNPGVSLALCQKPNCNNVLMIPINRQQSVKSKSDSKYDSKKVPFMCDKCGKGRGEGIHILTLIDQKYAICYECSKTYVSQSQSKWKYPSKSSKG